MKKYNVKNIKVIRNYRIWLLEARGLNEKSVIKMERAIHLYQDFTKNEDFNRFNADRAINFKRFLKQKKYREKSIATNSYRAYLIHLRGFLTWLCTQPGYRSRIKLDSLEYLTVSKKESRIASSYFQYILNTLMQNSQYEMNFLPWIIYVFRSH